MTQFKHAAVLKMYAEDATKTQVQLTQMFPSGTRHHHQEPNFVVRRLTPLECERLQGFPDNHTQVPFKGKSVEGCPDSPRYTAMGNSMAVPVMRWLGKRVHAEVFRL